MSFVLAMEIVVAVASVIVYLIYLEVAALCHLGVLAHFQQHAQEDALAVFWTCFCSYCPSLFVMGANNKSNIVTLSA